MVETKDENAEVLTEENEENEFKEKEFLSGIAEI